MTQVTVLQSHPEAKGKVLRASPQPHVGLFSCPAFKCETLKGASSTKAQGCDPNLTQLTWNEVERLRETDMVQIADNKKLQKQKQVRPSNYKPLKF